jgi:CRISPR-associated protein Cst1
MSLVRFTGHPLPDAGVATLCAMSGKDGPDELTLEDFDVVADELTANYFSGIMGSYLSCVFMNSEYVQPEPKGAEGRKKKAQTRKEYEERVLRAHRWRGEDAALGLRCAFSGEPATHLVHRSQIPMLTGEDVLNFFPAGRGRLPISGPYLVAIQALPMGGRRAEGKLLFSHSDDRDLIIQLAGKCVDDNRRLLNLARANGLPAIRGPDLSLIREQGAKDQKTKLAKYPDAKAPISLVAADLAEISLAKSFASQDPGSVTVYVMSSSGQARPPETVPLEIHPIPSQVVRFFRLVGQPPTATTWKALVKRSWRNPLASKEPTDAQSELKSETTKKKSKGGSNEPRTKVAGGAGRSRNDLYADFFRIFEADFTDISKAQLFLRRHLFRNARWRGVSTHKVLAEREEEWSLVDWKLTDLFLREVIGMDGKRVEKVREFADKLAGYIAASKDKRLFRDLVFAGRSWEVRNALTKAQRNQAKDQGNLLFGLQDYLEVFEADGAVGVSDWSLTRDLISIRLVESLHGKGFFKENPEVLETPEDETAAATA